MTNLHTIADRVKGVMVSNCLPMGAYEFMTNAAYKDSFRTEGWFYTPVLRKAHANGNISFIYNHLHLASFKRLCYRKPDIYVGIASMPDKHGYVSLSTSNTYEMAMIKEAKTVILEINPNAPRTFGDVQLHVDDVDYLVEVNYPIPEIADVEPNEKDLAIGKLIAEMINDGDCIQLGIGGIPNAVADSLMDKKDLGIHTEMFTDSMVELIECGAVNNSRKQINRGRSVTTFAYGSQRIYDFMDDNPSIEILPVDYTNDPNVICKNDNMISINSCISVDLFGQVTAESSNLRHISGTGGQLDFLTGACMSKGGKSFICLNSTFTDKQGQLHSNIVPHFHGDIVTDPRSQTYFVVTEYGAVNLVGRTTWERADLLVSIAHPDFRDQLIAQADKQKIWRQSNKR